MKTFKNVKNLIRNGDKEFVANQLKISASLVRMVVYGKRTDHYGILKAFGILIRHRELSEKNIVAEINALRRNLAA